MTESIRRQLKLNEVRAGRGMYAKMTAVERLLLVQEVCAGRA